MKKLLNKIKTFLQSEQTRFVMEEFLLPVPIALLAIFLFGWWAIEIVSVIAMIIFK